MNAEFKEGGYLDADENSVKYFKVGPKTEGKFSWDSVNYYFRFSYKKRIYLALKMLKIHEERKKLLGAALDEYVPKDDKNSKKRRICK